MAVLCASGDLTCLAAALLALALQCEVLTALYPTGAASTQGAAPGASLSVNCQPVAACDAYTQLLLNLSQ
jgi:hypothetical protein